MSDHYREGGSISTKIIQVLSNVLLFYYSVVKIPTAPVISPPSVSFRTPLSRDYWCRTAGRGALGNIYI